MNSLQFQEDEGESYKGRSKKCPLLNYKNLIVEAAKTYCNEQKTFTILNLVLDRVSFLFTHVIPSLNEDMYTHLTVFLALYELPFLTLLSFDNHNPLSITFMEGTPRVAQLRKLCSFTESESIVRTRFAQAPD